MALVKWTVRTDGTKSWCTVETTAPNLTFPVHKIFTPHPGRTSLVSGAYHWEPLEIVSVDWGVLERFLTAHSQAHFSLEEVTTGIPYEADLAHLSLDGKQIFSLNFSKADPTTLQPDESTSSKRIIRSRP